MARLALGVVGAAIGSFIPGVGTGIGWMIGSTIGGFVDPGKLPTVTGPRINDKRVTTSNYGVPIPEVYGTIIVAGDYDWCTDLEDNLITTSSGGKGPAPSQTTNGFYYHVHCRVSACVGPGRILKIKMNGLLVYENTTGEAVSDPRGNANCNVDYTIIGEIRLFDGDETQVADALEESYLGVGNVPGYRGKVGCVIEHLVLTKLGNRPPTFEFEVQKGLSEASTTTRLFSDADGANFEVLGLLNGWKFNPDVLSEGELWLPYANNADWFTRLDPLTGAYIGDAGPKTPITNSTPPQSMTTDVAGGFTYIIPGIVAPQHIYGVEHATQLTSKDLNVGTSTRLGEVAINPYTGLLYVTCSTSGVSNVYSRFREVDKVTGTLGTSRQPYGNDLNGLSYPLFDSSGLYAWFTTIDGTSIVRLTISSGATSTYNVTTPAAVDEIFATIYEPTNNALWMTGYIYSPDFLVVTVVWDCGTQTVLQVLEEPALDGGADTYAEPVLYDPYREVVWVYISDFYDENIDLRVGDYDYLVGFSLADFSILHTINVSTFAGDVDDDDIVDWAVGEAGLYVEQFIGATFANDFWLVTFGGGAPPAQHWQDVVQDVANKVGLGSYLNLPAETDADIVDGYRITAQMTARAAIEPLQPVFYFDGVESGATLKFVKRGAASAFTVDEDDLAAHDSGDAPHPLQPVRAQELELPQEVSITYIRGDGEYEQGMQYARRETVEAEGKLPIEVPIVLSDDKALEVAHVNLYEAWLARDRFTVSLTREYSKAEPTDVITAGGHLIRLLRGQDGGGVRLFEAVRTASDILTQAATAPANLIEDTYAPEEITDSTLVLLDIPMLRDEDDDSGFYVAVTSAATQWGGATLYKSVDGGTSYSAVETFLTRATIGETAGALANFTGGNVFDETSTVSVVLISGELSSTTELGALNGINTAAIGIDGRWEIVTFKTATLTAPLTYTLSSLLRGRLGTEWAIPTHQVGDTFVLLNSALKRIPDSVGQLGLDRLYKLVTSGQVIADVDPVTFSNDGVALKPYAPVQLTGERDGGNDLTLAWVRRTRIHWDSLDAREAPLGEESEAYEIDVLAPGSPTLVLDTYESTEETFLYTAAAQTADGLTPGDPVTVRIYQISATLGRGYVLEGSV